MNKTCNNCTYRHNILGRDTSFCPKYRDIEVNNMEICEIHKFACYKSNCHNEAEYKYENSYYCFDCLIAELKIEEHVTTVYYDVDGKHLGTSEDCNEVVRNLNKDIEVL